MFGRSFLLALVVAVAVQVADARHHAAYASASASQADKHAIRRAFAQDFAVTVLAILHDHKKKYADRKTLLRQAFSDSVDIDWIARFVIGRPWVGATPDQRERYTALYRKFLTESYVSNFAENPDKQIRDIKVFGVDDGDGDEFTVRTLMMLTNFENLNVSYLVREQGDRYKILDIAIENISLIETHRAQFSRLATSQGIGAVIAELEGLTSRNQSAVKLSLN